MGYVTYFESNERESIKSAGMLGVKSKHDKLLLWIHHEIRTVAGEPEQTERSSKPFRNNDQYPSLA